MSFEKKKVWQNRELNPGLLYRTGILPLNYFAIVVSVRTETVLYYHGVDHEEGTVRGRYEWYIDGDGKLYSPIQTHDFD